jgi:hypothetical protein
MKLTIDLFDVDLEIHYDRIRPNVRAYVTGLPENCYPAERGEVEGMQVFLGSIDITSALSDKHLDDIEDTILTRQEDYI